MNYKLDISAKAQKDIEQLKKVGDKVVLSKLLLLLTEIAIHPYTGTGKPETLKHGLSGLWSRRINREHRVVYEVLVDVVVIHSVQGHYLNESASLRITRNRIVRRTVAHPESQTTVDHRLDVGR